MLGPTLLGIFLLLSPLTTCSNAEICFCPMRENVITYQEPSLSSYQEGVINGKEIVKGSYDGEWIRLEVEKIKFARLDDFTICRCDKDVNGQWFDCIDNSCNKRARRQFINGGWSPWEEWTPCSQTCSNGTRERLRLCDNPPPSNGGSYCNGSYHEKVDCFRHCPQDGAWASWFPWSDCSVTCGNGTWFRTRACDNPLPRHGGKVCPGSGREDEICFQIECPINGGWSDWGSWSECSVTCENGTRVRNRTCDNPAPEFHGDDCVGSNEETDMCLTNRMCPIDGDWADWSSWSDCSETCNNGTLIRSRNCSNPEPQYGGKICTGKATEISICFLVDCPVDGAWSVWENWSSCSRTCDGGNQTRTRTCTNPTPSYGGLNCSGPEIQNEFCYLQSCKINGSWNTWEDWTPCSLTCSNGTRQRIRLCDNPPPSNGGSYCNGSFSETGDCFRYCPQDGAWASWFPWNDCSVTCGNGTWSRTRTCSNPLPLYGGKSCTGSNRDNGTCFLTECPLDGVWAEWSQWGSCSVTCASGTEYRSRNCTGPFYGGQDCPGNDTEPQPCVNGPCPIDGVWQNWGGWSQCSVTCDDGNSTRFRNCTVPKFGGNNCTGNGIERKDCFPVECPIDGSWGDWYPWNHCTVTCETGTKSRARVCMNPPPQFGGAYCQGSGRENVTCDMGSCDATSTTTDATSTPNTVDGNWGDWYPWSHCTVTCETGTKARARVCMNPPPQFGGAYCQGTNRENVTCDMGSCYATSTTTDASPTPNTGFGILTSTISTDPHTHNTDHSTYVHGSTTGGTKPTVALQTTQTTRVTCDDDPDGDCHIPSILHFVCQHNDTAEKYCKRSCGLCPKVDGGWSDWSSWSSCSVTCENGTHVRNRTCDNPAPEFGGDECVGSKDEFEDCYTKTMCPSPCVDLLDIECGKPNLLAFICQHENIADHYCKRSCGRCPKSECEDDPNGQCDSPSVLAFLCSHVNTAEKYCKRSCGRCQGDHTTHVNGSTTGATTQSGTGTATQITQDFKCHVCGNTSEQFCDVMYEEASCPYPYCVNEMRNDNFGVKYVTRKCGTERDCKIAWLSDTSGNDRCMNFDEGQIYNVAINCTYCCVNSLCNRPIRPDRVDLYMATP